MLPWLLAAALATSAPSPCPSDLLVANPRLKVARSIDDRSIDNYIFQVEVKNRGTAPQPEATRQHLALVRDGTVLGTQPIPPIDAGESYMAAFRVRLPHRLTRPPLTVEFRYVLDSKNASRANCTSVNDRLAVTL